MFSTCEIGNKKEDLEKVLSEYLDDLLVADGVLEARKTEFHSAGCGKFSMVVQVKQDPRVKFKIEIYPNETEEPYFKVTYQNVTCRFKLLNCEPMKAEAKNGIPPQIQKIIKQIKKCGRITKKN